MNDSIIKFLEKGHFDTTQDIKVTSIGSVQPYKGHLIVRDVQINTGDKDDIFIIVDNGDLKYSQGSFTFADIQASLDHFLERNQKNNFKLYF
jgi:hypothetical protein